MIDVHGWLGSGALAAALVAGCALTNGCTLLGAGIGGAAKPAEPEQDFPRSELNRIPLGRKVTVMSRSSGAIDGTFDGAWRNADGTLDLAAIALVNGSRRTRIEVRDIHFVRAAEKSSGAWVGAGVGFAVDALLLAAAASSASSSGNSNNSGSGSGQGIGSCPLIYSVDAESRHLDAEVLVATVFPGLDRTDYARLEHAKAENGEIRIEVEGQPGETQHVDQLVLLAADHAPGTELVPTQAGELRAIGHATPPTRARDWQNADILPKLRSADDDAWVSTPLGRSAERPEEVRDHVELEFSLAKGSSRGTLLLHARNTLWAAHLEREMLAVAPSAVDPLYASLRTLPRLQSAVRTGMVRELALLVKVEENGTWRTIDHVWPVGPATSRAVAVPVDLSHVRGQALRIRLDSSAGLWSLDRAALELGAPRVVKAVELQSATALDTSKQDRRQDLGRADARYFDMPDGERAVLAFRAPPPAPGLTRSVFVKATGWYSVHPDARRAPRVDLFGLIAEPRAFGRFSVEDVAAHARGGAK